jgi:hypothetical protein
MWSYKADISNYFNSIPVERLLPLLKEAIPQDPQVYRFIEGLLLDPMVYDQGTLIAEEKGIMAGCPLSTFLANLYLAELDRLFLEKGWLYARYSDDIILFAPTAEALEARVQVVHQTLAEKGLVINPDMPVEALYPYLHLCDYIILMSVFAGFGGQRFIEDTYNRIRTLKAEIDRLGLDVKIEVDGGVSPSNAKALIEAGAEILVAGSAVFKAEDPSEVIARMR